MEKKQILLLTNNADAPWVTVVTEATYSLGNLRITSETVIWECLQKEKYDLLIVDASQLAQDVVAFVEKWHRRQPDIPVVVATTSPTWQHARAVLMAGAADYIRHTFNQELIRQACREALRNKCR